MNLYNSLEEIVGIEGTAIALGNFDGVHVGHQELMERTVKAAKAANLKSAVFTFSNHPRNLLSKGQTVKNILYPEEKAAVIKAFGVDYMFNVPFDDEMRCMSAVEFIDKILLMKLKMQEVCCGFNFKFGHKSSGSAETLVSEGAKGHFRTHVLGPVIIGGEVVSSSRIRECIEQGDVVRCMRFMGRRYSIGGEVVVGNRLGKTIGFPTSNLIVDDSMVSPANGVYITYCTHNGKRYPSVTNVGTKPTVGEFSKNMETHIFDFDKELYGKTILVEFIKKTRDEKKFESMDALAEQIKQDCIIAKDYHSKAY
ncbi:MAG: bifunctional riboflavin kinase/FAD synthetase [Clostridiales bacterium]|nr:bifunctional riboflavin kinase/FAD synthetase [Clostridiales bacterium]